MQCPRMDSDVVIRLYCSGTMLLSHPSNLLGVKILPTIYAYFKLGLQVYAQVHQKLFTMHTCRAARAVDGGVVFPALQATIALAGASLVAEPQQRGGENQKHGGQREGESGGGGEGREGKSEGRGTRNHNPCGLLRLKRRDHTEKYRTISEW